jgi:molybdate transport system ATP-binding protein
LIEGIEAAVRLPLPSFALDVRLRLPGRGVSALFGPSGSGKTTLLRCIAGLQPGARGAVRVNGETWQDDAQGIFVPAHRRALGYVFQDANLFAHLDVRANLRFGLQRVPAAQRRVAWDQAIEWLDIGPLLDRRTERLSGGEKQRVAISRALLCSPRLLLLDEPLASLDAARKREILPFLERLHRELSIPMLYVSHAADEVARMADCLVLMEAGRALACGPLGETLARLDLPIRFGEDAGIVLHGVIAERDERWHLARVDFDGGSLWARDQGLPLGAQVRVRVLARDVSVATQAAGNSSIVNSLAAVVEDFGEDEHPALLLVRLRVGGCALLARLTRRSADRLGLERGRPVFAQVKAIALL